MKAKDSVVIVDIGGANLASIAIAIERTGRKPRLASDPDAFDRATHVILPGVGAAAAAMERLRAADLVPAIQELTQPVLGICLGMQILFQHSEEGGVDGIGVLPGVVRRLSDEMDLPVPHMGWNRVLSRHRQGQDAALLEGIAEGSHFYFVHSYAAPDGFYVQATSDYGGEFPAIVRARNFHGVQFHPEKSAGAGAKLLENFLSL